MFSELIKNFERVRRYLREFLVYGFRTREEVGSRSARSYDNERRRLESWLGDFMSFRRTASGKAVFFAADSRQLAHNPLPPSRPRALPTPTSPCTFCCSICWRGPLSRWPRSRRG